MQPTGQREGEARAGAGTVAVGGERSMVGSGNDAGDGESDAAAGAVTVSRESPAVEAFEDVRQLVSGDAVAGVDHGNSY